MLTSPDFKELLNLFGKCKVRYLVVGSYAVMKYTEPRFTKDLDLWISTDIKNAQATFNALKEFGAPLKDMTSKDFSIEGYFYQNRSQRFIGKASYIAFSIEDSFNSPFTITSPALILKIFYMAPSLENYT